MTTLTRESLEATLDRVFPAIKPYEKRSYPMRGDDPEVDRRNDERYAVSLFIDELLKERGVET